MSAAGNDQPPKLLEQMRSVSRVQRYALRTEEACCEWVRRHVKFHRMQCREDLAEGERKVEAFLKYLAVEGKLAASTQNQALNALLFLYDRVLEQPLEERVQAVRASKTPRIPTVLTAEEARQVIGLLKGQTQLVVKLLYGSGRRRMGALRLRVQEVDFARCSAWPHDFAIMVW